MKRLIFILMLTLGNIVYSQIIWQEKIYSPLIKSVKLELESN